MKIAFFNPGQEFKSNQKEYTQNWLRVRKAGDLILRKDVEDFEKRMAKYVGVKYAVSCNSGTDALFIALKALGIKEGDEVLVPSHTFVATVQVVNQVGATPILYDMDNMIAVTKNTKAIMVAHIAGEITGNMDKLLAIAKKENIYVIEDACQALGATQFGKKAGSFGIAGAFSHYPAKILGGPGDGGTLVTNSEKVRDYAIEYRNHWKADYSRWGINSRMDNVIASELNIKLARIKDTLKKREKIAKRYLKNLRGVFLPKDIKDRVWQDFIIRTKNRDELYSKLKEMGIETMKNEYPMPCGKLPKAMLYESETLRLPINEVLKDKEVSYIIRCINKVYGI